VLRRNESACGKAGLSRECGRGAPGWSSPRWIDRGDPCLPCLWEYWGYAGL